MRQLELRISLFNITFSTVIAGKKKLDKLRRNRYLLKKQLRSCKKPSIAERLRDELSRVKRTADPTAIWKLIDNVCGISKGGNIANVNDPKDGKMYTEPAEINRVFTEFLKHHTGKAL